TLERLLRLRRLRRRGRRVRGGLLACLPLGVLTRSDTGLAALHRRPLLPANRMVVVAVEVAFVGVSVPLERGSARAVAAGVTLRVAPALVVVVLVLGRIDVLAGFGDRQVRVLGIRRVTLGRVTLGCVALGCVAAAHRV